MTWKFLYANGIYVDMLAPTPPVQRMGDDYLMEAFSRAGVSSADMRRANRCRMYLHALTVADISSGDGRFIRRDAWMGRSDYHLNYHRYRWARQGRPGSQDWRAWRRAIGLALTEPGRLSGDSDPRLRCRLGVWTIPVPSAWRWFLHRDGNLLF